MKKVVGGVMKKLRLGQAEAPAIQAAPESPGPVDTPARPQARYPTNAPDGVHFFDDATAQVSYCVDGAGVFLGNLEFSV